MLTPTDPAYPARLRAMPGTSSPPDLTTVGDLDLLTGPIWALFCSTQCPGRLILHLYDLAQHWRREDRAIIGGFHTPLEQECLTVLLRGPAPVIICPARDITTMRLPVAWRAPLTAGRLLIVSPFDARHPRITIATAQRRNTLVATLADEVFVAHAAPSSKTEAFCRTVAAWGTPLYTLAGPENAGLIALGARALDEVAEHA